MTTQELLSVGWLVAGFFLLLELLRHAAGGTSGARSQLLRALLIGVCLVAAGGLWFSFRYSTAVTIIASAMAGIRCFSILAAPGEAQWPLANLQALAIFVWALLSVTFPVK